MAYLNAFRQSFGDTASRLYFSELLLLLPDAGKRNELQRCFEIFFKTVPAVQAPPPSAEWAKKATKPPRPW